MSQDLNNLIAELQADDQKFQEFVNHPGLFLQGRGMNEEDASTAAALATRANRLLTFTPTTLAELSNELGSVNFDNPGVVSAFTDNFTDNYSDNDHYTDSYTNSNGRMSVDAWTRRLVTDRGLDISGIPGSGFSDLP